MSKSITRHSVSLFSGAALLAGLAAIPVAQADINPFAVSELQHGYMVADAGTEGKCGANKVEAKVKEAQCGANKPVVDKAKDGQCGANKPVQEKAKDGQCGANKAPVKLNEAKCGEAKCGNNVKKG